MNKALNPAINLLVFEQLPFDPGPEFTAALNIYNDAFPAHERHPGTVIAERIRKGYSQLYLGRLDKEIVFMALLWPLEHTHFILLDYMTTHPAYRGKRIAACFLNYMKSILQKDKKYFILEAEDPERGINKIERQKRVDFYRRNGARQLKDVKYTLPALQGAASTEMILMIFPEYNDGTIAGKLVKILVIRIYRELYNRGKEDALSGSSGYDDTTQVELI